MPENRPTGWRDRDRLEREFLSEAEEIFDSLSVDLNRLEVALEAGDPPPSLINAIFRRIHSLKGLAGMQEHQPMVELAHDLEELLDRLRLGRAALTGTVLDRIHEAVDVLAALVRDLAEGHAVVPDLSELRARLRRCGDARAAPGEEAPTGAGLDPGLLSSLSEPAEQRLRAARAAGRPVALVRLALEPVDFDRRLREAAQAVEDLGELIATLPVVEEAPADRMAFDLLVAADRPEELARPLRRLHAVIRPLRSSGGAGAAPPGGWAPGDADPRGPTSTLRVPVSRLDDILALLGDMSIAAAALQRQARLVREAHADDREVRELERRARDLMPRLRALQRGAVETRLVPVEQVFARLARMVARSARAAGKEVALTTRGGQTELDKAMMDELAEALLHLLRNAVDHGIEPAQGRERAGKPRRGRLALSACRRGNQVTIEVEDDGRGISVEAVRAAAEATGRLGPGRPLSAEQAHELIFAPGFTTALRVSQLSGRGVGLDIVRQAIRRLKGSLQVRSTEGRGTRFTILVPISLALVQALIVNAAGRRFAIPITSIQDNLRIDPSRLRRAGDEEIYEHERGPVPIVRLAGLVPPSAGRRPGGERFAVIAGSPSRPIGIAVDALVGQQEVVIKPVGRRLDRLPGIAGAADLGDATAVLVLDPEGLGAGATDGRAAF
ncbi:MAG: chemotaxis protein CheA [Acidobacteriota bacterium]